MKAFTGSDQNFYNFLTLPPRFGDSATLLLSLGAVVTFTGASLTLGQNSPPAPSTDASRLRLPATCLQQRRASEKIVTLLGIVAGHLTAGAYNTLGELYAQAYRAQCAAGDADAKSALATFEGIRKAHSK